MTSLHLSKVTGRVDRTSAAMQSFELTTSRANRLLTGLFGVLWCGVLVINGIVGLASSLTPLVVIPIGMAVSGGLFFYRMATLGVRASASGLTVRNFTKTRTIKRAEITGFRDGRESMQPIGRMLYVVTSNDVIPLDFTRRIGKRRRERYLETLTTWLAGGDRTMPRNPIR